MDGKDLTTLLTRGNGQYLTIDYEKEQRTYAGQPKVIKRSTFQVVKMKAEDYFKVFRELLMGGRRFIVVHTTNTRNRHARFYIGGKEVDKASLIEAGVCSESMLASHDTEVIRLNIDNIKAVR